MFDFINLLKEKEDFWASSGVSEADIDFAEQQLNLRFSKDFRSYLKELGVASADAHEYTGIIKSKRLNVVDVTIEEKNRNPLIPNGLYVIERLGIDGIIIWQSRDGTIYQSVWGEKPKAIFGSLSDYVKSYE